MMTPQCAIDLSPADPCTLSLRLTAGMPYLSPTIRREDGSAWPSRLRLVFGDGTEWDATVDAGGTVAVITATAEQVDAADTRVTLRDDERIYATGRAWVRRVPL